MTIKSLNEITIRNYREYLLHIEVVIETIEDELTKKELLQFIDETKDIINSLEEQL